ncbi:unnamed protein product [Aureobasidium mustum]|uniref:Uncharacterized protein n=1 Tax=Aureobasidium mustum TaxID=2773714 RepID=A0A9N8PBD5_9PEZI|nr:unnamed protein product [Aureobasidium mustum]
MLDFLLFVKSMPSDVVESKLEPMLHLFTNQANLNYLPNSINHPLDHCDLGHQLNGYSWLSNFYSFF